MKDLDIYEAVCRLSGHDLYSVQGLPTRLYCRKCGHVEDVGVSG